MDKTFKNSKINKQKSIININQPRNENKDK